MGFSTNTYMVEFPDEDCKSTHSEREHGMSAPCRDFFEGEKTKTVFLSAYLSLCVEAAARDGLEEIYITKHPQVHREISMIQTGKDHQRLVPGCPRG